MVHRVQLGCGMSANSLWKAGKELVDFCRLTFGVAGAVLFRQTSPMLLIDQVAVIDSLTISDAIHDA